MEIPQANLLNGGARHLTEDSLPLLKQGQGLAHIGEELLAVVGEMDLPIFLFKELEYIVERLEYRRSYSSLHLS